MAPIANTVNKPVGPDVNRNSSDCGVSDSLYGNRFLGFMQGVREKLAHTFGVFAARAQERCFCSGIFSFFVADDTAVVQSFYADDKYNQPLCCCNQILRSNLFLKDEENLVGTQFLSEKSGSGGGNFPIEGCQLCRGGGRK